MAWLGSEPPRLPPAAPRPTCFPILAPPPELYLPKSALLPGFVQMLDIRLASEAKDRGAGILMEMEPNRHEECQAGTKRATLENKVFAVCGNWVYDSPTTSFVREGLLEGGFLEGLAQMDPDRHFEADGDVDRYEALLQMADLVVHHRSVPELLPELAQRLHKVASFEVASFSLYDPDKNVMRMHFWEGSESLSDLTELPVEESACGFVWEKQQPMVWPDLHQETRFQRAVSLLIEKGVRSYCTLPLTTAQKKFGALGLGSSRPNAYGEDDVQLLRRVAELVALALENAMTRAAFLEEKERLEMLLEVSTTLMSNLDVQQLFPAISDLIRRVVRQDYASLALYEEANQCLRVYALDSAFFG